MSRWWFTSALVAVPTLLNLSAAPASASIHCNVTIIMTTLGTDGTSTTTAAVIDSQNGVTTVDSAMPTTGEVPVIQTMGPTGSNAASGSGGGSTSGSNSAGGANPATTPSSPSGATGNPDVSTNPPKTDDPTTSTPTDPIPVENIPVDDGPPAPVPPVLNPTDPLPTDPTTTNGPEFPSIPVPTENTPVDDSGPVNTVNETPEPGTLTLMVLGAAGGFGYFRRKKAA